jgi:hypothetical protein
MRRNFVKNDVTIEAEIEVTELEFAPMATEHIFNCHVDCAIIPKDEKFMPRLNFALDFHDINKATTLCRALDTLLGLLGQKDAEYNMRKQQAMRQAIQPVGRPALHLAN